MMNKKIILIIAAVIVIIIALFLIFGGKKEPPKNGIIVTNQTGTGEQAGGEVAATVDPNAATISTSDDVFNQLDNAADYAG